MPHFVTPNSYGTARLQEKNPCHDPHSGRFAPRGAGNCTPLSPADSDIGARTHLTRSVRDKLAHYITQTDFDINGALNIAGPAFRQGYLSLMEKAPGAHAEMTRLLDKVINKIGGTKVDYANITQPGTTHASMGNIKGARRLIEKTVVDNFGDLTQARDVVRSSIAVDHPNQVKGVLDAVRGTFTVVREKDRFTNPKGGYRDHLLNVRMGNGLVGEIQVHVKPILRIKETQGHHLYQQLRGGGRTSAADITKRMAALYNSAWGVFAVAAASTVGRRYL